MDEHEYDGTGTGHQPYGSPGYKGPGQIGDEVAQALSRDLAEEIGADPTFAVRDHDERHALVVGRLVEDDEGQTRHRDSDVLASRAGDDEDLSAEEAGMHFIDPENDPIPE